MRALIVDDNLDFAKRLADVLGDSSEPLFADGLPEQVGVEGWRNELELRLKLGDAPDVVLLNRELRTSDAGRERRVGEGLFVACSWKFDARFLLYSFRSLPGDCPRRIVRLPSSFEVEPPPDRAQPLDLKIEDCLRFIDGSFGKIQHGYKEVSPTAVEVVRLIHGAVKAGVIRSGSQFDALDVLLSSFLNRLAELPDRILLQTDEFGRAVKRLVVLYAARAQVGVKGGLADGAAVPCNANGQKIVVVDDEVDRDGDSPWARTLGIIFAGDDRTFETRLPSVVRRNVSVLEDADLVVLDVDYRRDLSYEGDAAYGGLDLLEAIRGRLPRTPVLMMSRYDEVGLYEECLARGAFDYVTKSWSGYARRMTRESEKEWFLHWKSRLEVPLCYRPFFDDIELLRRREIIPRKESQRFLLILRDIGEPTHDTLVALANFFEQFVVGYLYYRGQTPADALKDCLDDPLLKSSTDIAHVGQALRIIRNNVMHNPAGGDERYDAWLILALLRTFYLGLLSPDRLCDTGWMSPFQEKFSSALACVDFVADARFFEDDSGQVSAANLTMLERRNDLLRQATNSNELGSNEFAELADAFVKSLAAALPRAQLAKYGLQLETLTIGNSQEMVKTLFKDYARISKRRFRRGYELFGAVWWLFELWDDFVQPGKQLRPDQKGVLRLLMARCWLWYFQQVLGEPNEILFSSALDELSVSRQAALTRLDSQLVEHFLRLKLGHFVSAYGLLVGLTHINEALELREKEYELESRALEAHVRLLEANLSAKENERARAEAALEGKAAEVDELEERMAQLAQRTTVRRRHEAYRGLCERLDNAKELIYSVAKEVQSLRAATQQITYELEEMRDAQTRAVEALEGLRDVAGGGLVVIDNVEILARRVRRQFRHLERFAHNSFDIADWLGRMIRAGDYQQADLCVSKLSAALAPCKAASTGK